MDVRTAGAPICDAHFVFLMRETSTLATEVAIMNGEMVIWMTQVSIMKTPVVIQMPEAAIAIL